MSPQRSRRDFITSSSLALGGLLLIDPLRSLAAAHPTVRWSLLGGLRPVEDLSLAMFQKIEGDVVEIESTEGAKFKAQITEVTDHSSLSRDQGYQQFSVLFQSELKEALPQAIYSVEHPSEGKCELFLVPIADQQPGITYQAVFSRMA